MTYLNGSGNGLGNGLPNQEQEQEQKQEEECADAHLSSPPLVGAGNDGAEPGEPLAEEIEPGERKAVPYAEVIEAYHDACPSMPRVTLLNPASQAVPETRQGNWLQERPRWAGSG